MPNFLDRDVIFFRPLFDDLLFDEKEGGIPYSDDPNSAQSRDSQKRPPKTQKPSNRRNNKQAIFGERCFAARSFASSVASVLPRFRTLFSLSHFTNFLPSKCPFYVAYRPSFVTSIALRSPMDSSRTVKKHNNMMTIPTASRRKHLRFFPHRLKGTRQFRQITHFNGQIIISCNGLMNRRHIFSRKGCI